MLAVIHPLKMAVVLPAVLLLTQVISWQAVISCTTAMLRLSFIQG